MPSFNIGVDAHVMTIGNKQGKIEKLTK